MDFLLAVLSSFAIEASGIPGYTWEYVKWRFHVLAKADR